MPKQPLIFHIGLHKTGTSFIQKTLLTNSRKLTAVGVTPARGFHPVHGNHNVLGRPLRCGYWQTFMAALTGLDGKVLVTSEGLTNRLRLMRDQEMATLAAHLKAQFNVRLVITLRRQDFLKESVFAEVATNSRQVAIENEDHYVYDFDRFLARLEKAFGWKAIYPGLYRDDTRMDLMEAFLKLAKIKLKAKDLDVVPPTRVSLHRRKVAFLATLPKPNVIAFRALRAVVMDSDAIADDGQKYLMSPEARAAFLGRYKVGNLALCKRYGTDWAKYLTTPTPNPDWTPAAPITESELKVLTTQMKAAKQGHLLRPALKDALPV
jgi:hypothetical protein